MLSFLSCILIGTFVLTIVMAFKVYSLNTESSIHKISAISISTIAITAFVEYEILRTTSVDQVDYLGNFHSVANIIVIYLSVLASRIFRGSLKNGLSSFWEGFFFSIYTICAISLVIVQLHTSDLLVSHSLNEGIWEYKIDPNHQINIAFTGWILCSVVMVSVFYWQNYFETKTKKKKNLLFWLAIVFSIIPPFMAYEFNYLPDSSGSNYNISPIMFSCVLVLTWVHTNFKLFEISPIAAMDNILDSMSNLVIITDPNFNIKYVNNATLTELPFSKASLLNMTLHSFANELQINDLDYLIEQITNLTDKELFDYEVSIPLDEKQYYNFTISPVFNVQKIKTGYLLIANNLTDYKRAEVKLIEYNHELERSNDELERFAYIASHDLKTPLRNVVSFLNLIQRKTKKYEDKSLNEYIDIAVSGATQMNRLIKDVLEISRINANELRKEPIDLNDTIFYISNILQKQMIASDASIQSDYLPTIEADQTQIKQLFQNLIENGIKYNKNEQPAIKIIYEEQEHHHLFQIKDNGIGIQKDYHKKVFEMFKRLHTLSDYEGTGIGLAICKKITTLYGGKIWLQSEQGEGSSFFFTLKKAS